MSDEDRGRPPDWPADEPPPSDEEARQAATLAAALEGADVAEDAEEELRELLATAGMIRASTRSEQLPAERRDALVSAALSAGAQASPAPRPASRWRRAAPLLAMAASVLVVFGAVLAGLPLAEREAGVPAVGAAALPAQALSRPSDSLLGRPIVDRAGAARRLDRVLADRMAGYRQIRLARR